MIDSPTEELNVQYLRGSAVPRYVERLDEVEWVTDRRAPGSPVARTLALVAVVVGLLLLMIGFASRLDAVPPADQFPVRIETPASSPR